MLKDLINELVLDDPVGKQTATTADYHIPNTAAEDNFNDFLPTAATTSSYVPMQHLDTNSLLLPMQQLVLRAQHNAQQRLCFNSKRACFYEAVMYNDTATVTTTWFLQQ